MERIRVVSSHNSSNASTRQHSRSNSGWAATGEQTLTWIGELLEESANSQRATKKLVAQELLKVEERNIEILKKQQESFQLAESILQLIQKI